MLPCSWRCRCEGRGRTWAVPLRVHSRLWTLPATSAMGCQLSAQWADEASAQSSRYYMHPTHTQTRWYADPTPSASACTLHRHTDNSALHLSRVAKSSTHYWKLLSIVTLLQFLSVSWRHSSFPRLSLLPLLTNTLPGPSASEVTTLLCYTNLFIIIVIIIFWSWYSIPREWKKLRYAIQKSTKIKLEWTLLLLLLQKTVMQ